MNWVFDWHKEHLVVQEFAKNGEKVLDWDKRLIIEKIFEMSLLKIFFENIF